jgi:hypothetical protein
MDNTVGNYLCELYKNTMLESEIPLEYVMCLVPHILLPNGESRPLPPLGSNIENYNLRSQNLRLVYPENKTELQKYLGQLLTYTTANRCGNIHITANNILLALHDVEQIGNDIIDYIKSIANYSNEQRRRNVDIVLLEYSLRNGARTYIRFFHQDVKRYRYIEFIYIVSKILSIKTGINSLSYVLSPLMVKIEHDHYDMAHKFLYEYVVKTTEDLSLYFGLTDMVKDDILFWGNIITKETTEQKTKAGLQFALLLIKNTLVNSINDLPTIGDSIDVLGDLVNAQTFPSTRNF